MLLLYLILLLLLYLMPILIIFSMSSFFFYFVINHDLIINSRRLDWILFNKVYFFCWLFDLNFPNKYQISRLKARVFIYGAFIYCC